LLEQQIVPLYYDRDPEGIPRGWIDKMKNAIRLNCPYFNTARMVRDYAMQAYFPASDRHRALVADNYAAARDLARWKAHLFEHWYEIKIEDIDISEPADIQVNQTISVKARLRLGALTPADVQVELYQGTVSAEGEIADGQSVVMEYQGDDQQQSSIYTINICYNSSGLQGLSLRVLPKNEYLSSPYEPGLILWAEPS
jgi:starch phosphorylase